MIEVESEILSEAIECNTYHKPRPEYGYRAWIAIGKKVDVVYWDTGNGWCAILDVVPKDGKKKTVLKFYRKLQQIIKKNYDESGFRISE
jgi:hypothetical protein